MLLKQEDRIIVSDNFYLDEFIDPVTYRVFSNKMKSWIFNVRFIEMVGIAQYIRKEIGQGITINDWATGGQFQFSGFRPDTCTIGSPNSEHKRMNALDLKAVGFDGAKWEMFVIEYKRELIKLGVTRIESKTIAKSWLHLDCKDSKNTRPNTIKVIDLKNVLYTI